MCQAFGLSLPRLTESRNQEVLRFAKVSLNMNIKHWSLNIINDECAAVDSIITLEDQIWTQKIDDIGKYLNKANAKTDDTMKSNFGNSTGIILSVLDSSKIMHEL